MLWASTVERPILTVLYSWSVGCNHGVWAFSICLRFVQVSFQKPLHRNTFKFLQCALCWTVLWYTFAILFTLFTWHTLLSRSFHGLRFIFDPGHVFSTIMTWYLFSLDALQTLIFQRRAPFMTWLIVRVLYFATDHFFCFSTVVSDTLQNISSNILFIFS